MPKEISDYLNKMGARIPNIKPGKATIEYLTKIQASTRFWGIIFILKYAYYLCFIWMKLREYYFLLGSRTPVNYLWF